MRAESENGSRTMNYEWTVLSATRKAKEESTKVKLK
jgi:hypothetical protein